MKPFTVLLLYPDYIAETFGHETYLAFVEATDVVHAIEAAQRRATRVNLDEISPENFADFYPVYVAAGHHYDLNSLSEKQPG